MSAPRLLDKKLIMASLATERKEEIDKGLTLAKSIDSLRETKAKEERNLEEFRVTTLKSVQMQIEAKQLEYERLAKQNKTLSEEREKLLQPVDLSDSWREVKERERVCEELTLALAEKETELEKRELSVKKRESNLSHREREVERTEFAINENLRMAENDREQAKTDAVSIRLQAKKHKAEVDEYSHAKKTELAQREEDVLTREKQVEESTQYIIRQKQLIELRLVALNQAK